MGREGGEVMRERPGTGRGRGREDEREKEGG